MLWDEPATFRSILANYEYKDSQGDFILLKRRTKALSIVPTSNQIRPTSSGITLSSVTGVDTLKFAVKQSVQGRLKKLLFRGRPYFLEYIQGDDRRTFRFVRENSNQGFLITLPLDWEGLKSLLKDPASFSAPRRTIIIHALTEGMELENQNLPQASKN